MKAIGQRVNLIPIISKADSLTDDELQMNKEIIKKSIEDNHINVYDFVGLDPGQLDNSEDEEESTYLQLLQETYPFSIISSAGTDNEGVKYRSTPWGNINIEDHEICNFTLLKNVLLGSHVQEFKDQTIRNQYEAFRIEQLLDKSVVN
jgi:septin family protein